MVESIACGTPVITSDFGSMREIAADGGARAGRPARTTTRWPTAMRTPAHRRRGTGAAGEAGPPAPDPNLGQLCRRGVADPDDPRRVRRQHSPWDERVKQAAGTRRLTRRTAGPRGTGQRIRRRHRRLRPRGLALPRTAGPAGPPRAQEPVQGQRAGLPVVADPAADPAAGLLHRHRQVPGRRAVDPRLRDLHLHRADRVGAVQRDHLHRHRVDRGQRRAGQEDLPAARGLPAVGDRLGVLQLHDPDGDPGDRRADRQRAAAPWPAGATSCSAPSCCWSTRWPPRSCCPRSTCTCGTCSTWSRSC